MNSEQLFLCKIHFIDKMNKYHTFIFVILSFPFYGILKFQYFPLNTLVWKADPPKKEQIMQSKHLL